MLVKQLLEKEAVGNIFFPAGLLHSPQHLRRSEWNPDAVDLLPNRIRDGIGISDAATALHKVHQDFVRHTHDSELVNFTRLDLLYGLVGQAHEATDNALLVFRA